VPDVSTCNFTYFSCKVHFSFLLNNLFSYVPNLIYSLSMREEISEMHARTHKATCKIIFVCVIIFRFLDVRECHIENKNGYVIIVRAVIAQSV
jgi:hypothetical protein